METALRLEINVFALLVIVILWLSGDRPRISRSDADSLLYRAVLLSTGAMLSFDTISWFCGGKTGSWSRYAVYIANTLYFIFHSLPASFAILYADFQLFGDKKRFPKLVRPLILIVGAVAVLAILSPFTGILFSVNSTNRYVRGPWFWAFGITQFGISIYLLGHIIRNRKRLNRRILIALLAYPIPMLIATSLQILFYGLVLLWPTMALCLIVVAFNIEGRRAKTDYLTGTANRRSLDEKLERRIDLCKSGRTLCGLLLDIDDFKKINDVYGHEAGDRTLEDLANILLACVRVEDHVARMGGDEFVVLVDFIETKTVEELVRRIENAVENLNASKQRPYRLSLSIGRSIYGQGEGCKASDFLSMLDADMYARKRDKKLRDKEKKEMAS